MERRKDKGKLIQPLQFTQQSSAMSISSEEEKTEKIMSQAIMAGLHYQDTQDFESTTQLYNAQVYNQRLQQVRLPKNKHFTQGAALTSHHIQKNIIKFGDYALEKCNDLKTKFRAPMGTKLTEKQQCLLDNLWHIQTLPQASNFKLQVLNALSIYFQEQSLQNPEKHIQKPKFTHYIIFRGLKIGIFNKWETVAKYIQCPNPIFKGYTCFAEALKTAREQFGLNNFYIEPEEVKTFLDMAKTNPEQIIKAQEELIAQLQQQLEKQGKDTNSIQDKMESCLLKQKMQLLEAKNIHLTQQLEKKENIYINRNYDMFKARMLDTPWRHCLEPVISHIPELENIISQKICTEFPIQLLELQQKLCNMAFKEDPRTDTRVVQREDEDSPGPLLLQINLMKTDMTDEEVLQFYHNGMIDYLEFSLNPKTERLLDKFGEKFIMVAGNISTHNYQQGSVGCKIISSFPYADDYTYRPARKRIFISHTPWGQSYLKGLANTRNINFTNFTEQQDPKIIIENYQKTPEVPITMWYNFTLLAEGHYLQIWAHKNWNMLLPFVGEGDFLQLQHIRNEETPKISYGMDSDPGSPPSIDSTHRDF